MRPCVPVCSFLLHATHVMHVLYVLFVMNAYVFVSLCVHVCVCVESIDVDGFVKNLQKCGQSTRDATLFWDSLMIKVLVYWPSI